jgi:hypothetical protein
MVDGDLLDDEPTVILWIAARRTQDMQPRANERPGIGSKCRVDEGCMKR